jgi:hypothetical protein
LFEGDAGLEVLLGLGQGFELFVGGHEIGVGIALAPFALGVDDRLGEEAGAVEVEVGGEDADGEDVDPRGEASLV